MGPNFSEKLHINIPTLPRIKSKDHKYSNRKCIFVSPHMLKKITMQMWTLLKVYLLNFILIYPVVLWNAEHNWSITDKHNTLIFVIKCCIYLRNIPLVEISSLMVIQFKWCFSDMHWLCVTRTCCTVSKKPVPYENVTWSLRLTLADAAIWQVACSFMLLLSYHIVI